MKTMVYFVPIVDISWVNLGPLNPRKNYIAEAPPIDLCHQEAEAIIDFMKGLYGGKFAFAVYTGTYCRDGFTEQPFMDTWRRAVHQGAEILVHTHEEIAKVGTKNSDKEHMTKVICRQHRRFIDAGITPVGFRGGLYGYASFLTPLLEELGLTIDFSAAPGIDKPDREAIWTGIPYTAFYLCRDSKLDIECCRGKSNVLEIPIGADSKGSDNTNYHYVDYDLSTLDTAKDIWDAVVNRAKADSKPQFIHVLFHTFSMSNNNMIERYKRFADHMFLNGGQVLTPTEAKREYDSIAE